MTDLSYHSNCHPCERPLTRALAHLSDHSLGLSDIRKLVFLKFRSLELSSPSSSNLLFWSIRFSGTEDRGKGTWKGNDSKSLNDCNKNETMMCILFLFRGNIFHSRNDELWQDSALTSCLTKQSFHSAKAWPCLRGLFWRAILCRS